MKKKGFTLVELLAVIAILAILAIIALPNIMNLFNQAKQNSFENELKEIFKTAEQEWMKDSMIATNNVIYARCKSQNCSKQLSLTGREEIEYYIDVNKAGKVIKYFATDGSYQYEYIGNGLKIEEIGNSEQVANLQTKDIITVKCSGAKKGGVDITSGIPLQGNNVATDCASANVKNTIPSGARGLYKIMAQKAYLDNVKSTNVSDCHGINFNAISSDSNGKGVYELASTKNDLYPIYYYRGQVTDNNVKFGGFCWKAVRTTNTGGVKLIYNGRPTSSGQCTNTTGEATQIGTSKFNEDKTSPAYLGYMYGTTYTKEYKSNVSAQVKFGKGVTYSGGTYTLTNTVNAIDNTHHYTCFNETGTCTTVNYVYYYSSSSGYYYITITGEDPKGRELIDVVKEKMHNNNKESTAKKEIENWYKNNLAGISSKLEDTVFCNDRSTSDEAGWNSQGNISGQYTLFKGYKRASVDHIPSLVCERVDDRFTQSIENGNGKLNFPIGLLSVDEVMLAGGRSGRPNNTYYLYTNTVSWIGTPHNFDNLSGSFSFLLIADGRFVSTDVNNSFALRPVISISRNTNVTSGTGATTDPYIVE